MFTVKIHRLTAFGIEHLLCLQSYTLYTQKREFPPRGNLTKLMEGTDEKRNYNDERREVSVHLPVHQKVKTSPAVTTRSLSL